MKLNSNRGKELEKKMTADRKARIAILSPAPKTVKPKKDETKS